jgi:hypothetical protein
MGITPENPDSPISLGRRRGSSLDYRDDLGYGRTSAKFHTDRVKSATYPYVEEDSFGEDIDLGLEIDVLDRIINKFSTPYKSDDSLIGRSADHNAKVDGNKPLAPVQQEMAVAKGMVPFPSMYKKRIQVGGGVAGGAQKYVRGSDRVKTGTWDGWSHAPEEIGGPEGVNITFDEYISDEEDANILKLRKVVQGILDQQELE